MEGELQSCTSKIRRLQITLFVNFSYSHLNRICFDELQELGEENIDLLFRTAYDRKDLPKIYNQFLSRMPFPFMKKGHLFVAVRRNDVDSVIYFRREFVQFNWTLCCISSSDQHAHYDIINNHQINWELFKAIKHLFTHYSLDSFPLAGCTTEPLNRIRTLQIIDPVTREPLQDLSSASKT